MDNSIILMIIGMAIVTYIPRMIPLVSLGGKELHPFLQGVLKNVPFATLGALIVPGIFLISEDPWFGIIGAVIAFLIAYFGANVIVVVLGTIGVLTCYSIFV
ncbi:branched-subunit amino acid transport protein [Bacillus mesophilus]|uniref:AzlD domain-containing protein n=1 Tax=Bacillus mesophilus TaxID=1808955 RepID=A0A6M0Q3H7_9BACI|nr:AzlD domain-containing protein [Bacillus mesophilus]MBM7659854.1 branched-subunit amino acid transport protein [Bacillus mesophilus]NEY70713.1 AzlD domain-containing protein [Bacillus mesophilus]